MIMKDFMKTCANLGFQVIGFDEEGAFEVTTDELDERILEDDYPVYLGYAYVVDGTPKSSPLEGTVRDLKFFFAAKEIRRCDLVGRGLC
jgi:hypothetical protein